MLRLPPRATPTYTLFPSTALFRSLLPPAAGAPLPRPLHPRGARRRPRRLYSARLRRGAAEALDLSLRLSDPQPAAQAERALGAGRSEEHTSELQSLMRISYAVFCLKTKTNKTNKQYHIVNNY